jgi:pantoate kinase
MEFINSILDDPITNQKLTNCCKKIINNLVNDPEQITMIKIFTLTVIRDEEVVSNVRKVIKQLINDLLENPEMEDHLNKYVSRVLMTTLDQPVNEMTIRNKIVQILRSDDVIDSVSTSLIDVSNKEEVKKQIANNLLSGVMKVINPINYVR